MMAKFDLIIFDLDGVLVDSISVIEKTYSQTCQAIGLENYPNFEEYKVRFGKDLKTIAKELKMPDSFVAAFAKLSLDLSDHINLYAEIPELLTKLKTFRNLRLSIATGKEGIRARALLKKLKLTKFFDLVLGGDDVGQAKPNPEIILHQIDYFGVQKNRVLFIGDSSVDMLAGKNSGVQYAAALWGYGDLENILSQNPHYLLKNPDEILTIVSG